MTVQFCNCRGRPYPPPWSYESSAERSEASAVGLRRALSEVAIDWSHPRQVIAVSEASHPYFGLTPLRIAPSEARCPYFGPGGPRRQC